MVFLWTMSYLSEPGLEGELSEEIEVTEATDRGLWEEGMVNERTMEGGRDPRRSSAVDWYHKDRKTTKSKRIQLKSDHFGKTDN